MNQEWMLAIAYYRGILDAYREHPLIKKIIDKVNKDDYIYAPIADNRMYRIIEQFHRDSNDYFTNCSLLRLDLRSDYEKKEYIYSILKLIIPSSFTLFNCEKIVTKSFDDDVERENALYELGFKNPNKELIGHSGEKHLGYVELLK